jgi:uncharacterized membrane protein YgdD (TMEM256/DUF423 family)
MPARLIIGIAGLIGAVSVGLAAMASHGNNAVIATAANFGLLHAAALVGIARLRNRVAQAAGIVLIVGILLFAGDLVTKGLSGASPLPIAAPIGGGLLILGWLVLAASALVRGERDDTGA